MNKELQVLFENELLNDETKHAIKEALETIKSEAVNEAKSELEVEYAEKLVKEKKELAVKLPELVTESVGEEIESLKSEIDYYKNLDVMYAKRLQEFKNKYNQKMTENMVNLVEGVVKAEVGELRESVMEAKRAIVGKRVVEAILADAAEFGISDESKDMKSKLETTSSALKEAKAEVAKLVREKKMTELLSSLKGTKRDIMSSILEGVETDNLEKRYEETISRVLGEEKTQDLNKDEDRQDLVESINGESGNDELEEALFLSGITTK